MTASSTRPARVVVVGAGIAGLSAATAVRRERPDVEVLVLEATGRVGGKLRLAEVGGVAVDVGAESILNRRPEGVALARASGLGDRVVHPATTAARIWSRGRLHSMPRSILGVPVDLRSASGLLSAEGVARAELDAVLPATEIGEEDVSVGWLVEQRLGPEVVDRLVEPLLGGVYAGHARELSARAATPQLVALLARDRSLVRAAGEAVGEPSDVPLFAGLVGGVGQLPVAVAAGLDLRTTTTVRDLVRSPEGGWHVVTGPAVAPSLVAADAVVVAVPATPASRMLAGAVPAAALELAGIEYASMAVITLAFPADRFPAVEGSGFLVPPVDGRTVKAATYSFAKWQWVRDAADDLVVLRTSIGRHREERALQVPDEELVARSLADLREAVGLDVPPVDQHVQRWGGGLPQYAVGHLDRVRRIRSAVAEVRGLAVCGAAYDGLGIPACIASAERAARQVLDQLPTHPGTASLGSHGRMDP
ncbi:MAG TPA: protoporphyrinogen oxidase [Marmoricola sp.]|nr:protoporphyrinogen oxidase [Marmoricola sp.]